MGIERVTGIDDEHHGLDEIVASGASFHLERMSHQHIWLVVSDEDGNSVTINLHAKGTIKASICQDRVTQGKT